MTGYKKLTKRLITTIAWIAKAAGIAILLLVIAIAIGEGLPSRSEMTPRVSLLFVCLLTSMAGTIIALRRQGTGGLLIVAGVIAFWIVNGRFADSGFFPLLASIGLADVLCEWFKKSQAHSNKH